MSPPQQKPATFPERTGQEFKVLHIKLPTKPKKTLWPLLWMGFSCLKATTSLRGDSLLFYQRLSQPWSQPVLNPLTIKGL